MQYRKDTRVYSHLRLMIIQIIIAREKINLIYVDYLCVYSVAQYLLVA